MQITDTIRQHPAKDLDLPSNKYNSSALVVSDIKKSLGGSALLRGVSFEAAMGQITGLIGPNGAGKSTLLNIIGGLVKPDSGSIMLGSTDLTELPTRYRARLGLIRTFQIARDLNELTVLENMLLAAPNQIGEGALAAIWRRRAVKRQERSAAAKARQLLDRVGLWKFADLPARHLSGGQKKLLELARALMLDPKVILLDEPAAGVSPPLRVEISRIISGLRDEGRTLVIVEHDMDVVARLCDRVFVIAEGANLTDGTFRQVMADKRVIGAYLGGVV